MKININEIYFDESDLGVMKFESETKKQEHISEYGSNLKYMELFHEDNYRSVIIPHYMLDKNGNPISRRKEKDIPSESAKFEHLMNLVFIGINENWMRYKTEDRGKSFKELWLKPDFNSDIYTYICYRKDIPNAVGICSSNKPLHKKEV